MAITTDDVIAAYVQLRDQLDEKEKAHKAELAPMRDKIGKLETWLQNALQSQNLTSLKGKAGTAFVQTVASVGVQDWEKTLDFIKSKQLWEILDRRVSKTVILDYVDTHGEVPPGVEIKRANVVRVRRG